MSVESWHEPKASGHSELVFLPAGAGTCQRHLLDFLTFSVSTSEENFAIQFFTEKGWLPEGGLCSHRTSRKSVGQQSVYPKTLTSDILSGKRW